MKLIATVVSLFLLCAFAADAQAALTVSEINQAVAKSGVFPEATKVSAVIQGVEVLISTSARNSTDDDLKIQTVLLARKIFEADQAILRVTAHYYGANPSAYKKVSVSTLDVKAYSAGLADQAELLKSITVVPETDSRFADSGKSSGSSAQAESQSDKDTKGETKEKEASKGNDGEKISGKNSKDSKEPIKKGPYEKVTVYGMTLFYPSDWEIDYPKKDRGDHLAYKLKASHNEYVELKYYPGAVSPEAVLESAYSSHKKTDADHQRVALPLKLKIGVGKSLNAAQVGFWHTKEDKAEGNHKIYERQVSFGWPKRVYKLKCRSSSEQAGNFSAVFEKLLSSISVSK